MRSGLRDCRSPQVPDLCPDLASARGQLHRPQVGCGGVGEGRRSGENQRAQESPRRPAHVGGFRAAAWLTRERSEIMTKVIAMGERKLHCTGGARQPQTGPPGVGPFQPRLPLGPRSVLDRYNRQDDRRWNRPGSHALVERSIGRRPADRARIAQSDIDFLIFFWDPLEPLPHDPDIKALLRIAVLYNIPTACNRATADFLISSPLMRQAYDRIQPELTGRMTP